MYEKYKLGKPKRRRTLSLGGYEAVVPFDFVANTPLEECLSRAGSLQDLRELDPWVPVVRVRLEYVDDHTYGFKVIEREPAPVEMRGYMNRLDVGSTYISGEVSIKLSLQVGEYLSLFALVIVLSLFVGFFVAVLFAPLLGGFVWVYWRGARKERDRLVAMVRDTLSR